MLELDVRVRVHWVKHLSRVKRTVSNKWLGRDMVYLTGRRDEGEGSRDEVKGVNML